MSSYETHPDQDKILNAISPFMEGIVTSFVLIAEFVNADGDKRLYSATMNDQRAHMTLGLLAYGDAVERHRAVQVHFEDDDE